MPTYEYQCENCGKRFEVEQRMTDDALTSHDECGGHVVKVFGSVGVVYKGSGFYKTDSRTGASVPKKDKTDSAPSAPKESSTTKKEAVPAKPAEKKDNKSSS